MKSLTPEQFGKLIGHSRDFVRALIAAGEIVARDERRPGAKVARWKIDALEAERWRERRSHRPDAAQPATMPAPQHGARGFGLVARRRTRRALQAAALD